MANARFMQYGPYASRQFDRPSSRSSNSRRRRPPTPPAPSSELQKTYDGPSPDAIDTLAQGLTIERPRSALHRGDFREDDRDTPSIGQPSTLLSDSNIDATRLATSPVAPWHADFPAARLGQRRPSFRVSTAQSAFSASLPARSYGTSRSSVSGSFTYQPPTSPLVQQSSATDPTEFDISSALREQSRSPSKGRRHTDSPQYFQAFRSSLDYDATAWANRGKPLPSVRRKDSLPYQAHQPRRSLNSLPGLPQSPLPRSRRPSASEGSPLQRAPLVGSYEESILRGRMSSIPSKPLNFVAQIGVLGKGACKSSLRCPPHVSVPFPAVFYSYGSGNGRPGTHDQPSPYVGLVDLENSLRKAEDPTIGRQRRRCTGIGSEGNSRPSSRNGHYEQNVDTKLRRRRKEMLKRRSLSPREPPGGSYRIPQQGQLQIVIKNPNKTAVKLFLVPYDLSDMEAGQKTFIRQRSYSAGPIIDMPLSARSNLGTDRPEAALSASDDPRDRPVLRCIRVVFANRVPDGKENLRNEIQLPEPRYSIYKPGKDSGASILSSAAGTPVKDDACQQRSLALSQYDGPDDDFVYHQPGPMASASFTFTRGYDGHGDRPTQPIPFTLARLPTVESRPVSRGLSASMDIDAQHFEEAPSPVSPGSTMTASWLSTGSTSTSADAGDGMQDYPRQAVSKHRVATRSESLLSKRLKGLDVGYDSENCAEQ
ncbi:hypothetical protein LTR66_009987 [Elasticomyces elasticus]|nr:hypothetical protein LTR66_009987 [Elasticomyces elasticus]